MDLNIRNVPEELIRHAKILAIERGGTLREFVIEAIEAAVKAQKKPRR